MVANMNRNDVRVLIMFVSSGMMVRFIVVYIFYSFASQTFMLWIGIIAIVIGALLIIYPLICFIFGWD